jgi:hypothetical protein
VAPILGQQALAILCSCLEANAARTSIVAKAKRTKAADRKEITKK